MPDSIIVAVIGGIITLIGTIITVLTASSKSQAVTDTKLEVLSKEVGKHNDELFNIIKELPAMEEKIDNLDKRVGMLEVEVRK